MEALFKKHFWVLNVVALTVVAWLTARTVVEVLTTKYLTVTPEPTLLATNGHAGPLLEKANHGDLAETLAARSPFNVDEKRVEKVEDKDCAPTCEDKKCGDDGCGGTCGDCAEGEECSPEGTCAMKDEEPEQTALNLQLVGTAVNGGDAGMTFATITLDGGPAQFLTVGSEVGTGGTATVIDIQPMAIYLKEGGKITYQGLWQEQAKAGPIPPKGMPPTPGVSRPAPNMGAPVRPEPNAGGGGEMDATKGVKRISDTEFQLDRQMIDQQLSDLTQLGMAARVIPNYKNGKYEGFKLVGVRPGSLYRAIGIRSGDILRSINGQAINSPNKAMELFNQLRSQSRITMEVERRGKIENFQYSIQ